MIAIHFGQRGSWQQKAVHVPIPRYLGLNPLQANRILLHPPHSHAMPLPKQSSHGGRLAQPGFRGWTPLLLAQMG
ncbi:MAG: hypothetical protein ACI9X4_001932 [Glaciecola sp.]|jgi:hypothetical protein